MIKDNLFKLFKLRNQRVVTSASRDWSLGLAWWQGVQPWGLVGMAEQEARHKRERGQQAPASRVRNMTICREYDRYSNSTAERESLDR
jgi:hypothetical protein